MAVYTVRKSSVVPAMKADWNDPVWQQAQYLELVWAHAKSSSILPKVECRFMHTGDMIHGIYQVTSRTVYASHMEYNSSVCQDSCCEFFFMPTEKGYFNLEMNCVANHLIYYVRDCTEVNGEYKDFVHLPEEDGKQIKIVSTLGTEAINPERECSAPWAIQFAIPVSMLEKYAGAIGKLDGKKWRGNFYKCGDEMKDVHWMGWQAVEPLNFHQPRFFGDVIFE